MPHASVRYAPGGISEAPRGACETLEGGDAPGISRLGQSDAGMWAHGALGGYPMADPEQQGNLMPLSPYRRRPWGRSIPA